MHVQNETMKSYKEFRVISSHFESFRVVAREVELFRVVARVISSYFELFRVISRYFLARAIREGEKILRLQILRARSTDAIKSVNDNQDREFVKGELVDMAGQARFLPKRLGPTTGEV